MLLRKLKRILKLTVLVLAGLAAAVYVVDYAVFRIRVARNWNPFGSVTVLPYTAVQLKSGKTSFIFEPPQPQTCIHALLPHAGYTPCWYLTRHREPRTDI